MTAPAGVRSQAPELGTDEVSPRREEQRSMIKDADRSVGATISHRVCQEQRTRVHRATQSVVRQRTSCTVFRRSIPDEKRFFPGISVPVLTRRADCSLVALNPAHSSRLLPVCCDKERYSSCLRRFPPSLSFPHSSQIMLNCIFPLPYVFPFHPAQDRDSELAFSYR
jgi:hypothetical protein